MTRRRVEIVSDRPRAPHAALGLSRCVQNSEVSGEAPSFAHRWRIESPDGRPVVEGICARCGARRAFAASLPELIRRGGDQ